MTGFAGDTIPMRTPCPGCAGTTGAVTTVNGQDTVRCADCSRFCYNAPRRETGRPARRLRTRPGIPVRQRARILARDNSTCVLCHRSGVPLDVGHLLSVRDGQRLGLSEQELFNDENLAAMCEVCNSGLSGDTVPLRLAAGVLMARLTNIQNADQAAEGLSG